MGSTVGIHLIWTTYGTWLPGDPAKPGHWSPMFDVYGRLVRAGHRINMPDVTTYEHARSMMKEEPKILSAEERQIVADVIGSHIAPALAGVNAGNPLESRQSSPTDAHDIRTTHVALAGVDERTPSTPRPSPKTDAQSTTPRSPATSSAVDHRTITPAEAGADCVRAYACAIEPTHVHLLVSPVREDIGRFTGRLKGTTSSALLQHPENWGRTRAWTSGYWKVFLFDLDALPHVAAYIESHNTRAGRPPSLHPWVTPHSPGLDRGK